MGEERCSLARILRQPDDNGVWMQNFQENPMKPCQHLSSRNELVATNFVFQDRSKAPAEKWKCIGQLTVWIARHHCGFTNDKRGCGYQAPDIAAVSLSLEVPQSGGICNIASLTAKFWEGNHALLSILEHDYLNILANLCHLHVLQDAATERVPESEVMMSGKGSFDALLGAIDAVSGGDDTNMSINLLDVSSLPHAYHSKKNGQGFDIQSLHRQPVTYME
ncbi:hypothetical protein ARMGADRAFT_1038022 [Armillaria gallica]|uniref:Uncharacterized protein n=1 Tax=Armillaria gallica TaxID=47427 RepID=A0A2H3CVJ9_ARMGA|nr:hypothetical protein ARMGADRAFT_1038022 [Armillaria gallica]